MLWRLILLLLCAALPGHAQQRGSAERAERAERVVAGLSQNRVAITANFDGSEILIFGAVRREAPPPDAGPLEVIVALAGPSEDITVRRKSRQYGIWVNTDSFTVEKVPSFYAIATSNPLVHILGGIEDLEHRISIPHAVRTISPNAATRKAYDFTSALIRVREKSGLYFTQENTVDVSEETLFNTSVSLPANLTEGIYVARIFLTRDMQVVDEHETPIYVSKVGLERWIFNLAHERPLIYGILSLIIAIAAGWGASAVFRFIRP